MFSLYLYLNRAHEVEIRSRVWVSELNSHNQRRSEFHAYLLYRDLDDVSAHYRYTRMNKQTFDWLLRRLEPRIAKLDTTMRQAISPMERLSITLNYLATGNSFTYIADRYMRGASTVGEIVEETCQAIWDEFSPEYLSLPSTPEEWCTVAKDFESVWQFPNCLGAVDGKHVKIRKPPNSGSANHNYKGTFSINLMAMCDAHYRFLYIDCGADGRWQDTSVLADGSWFGYGLVNDGIRSVPPPDERGLPYVFLGDEGFPLKPWFMRPFPGSNLGTLDKKIFNYRLSRARRVIENAFGILTARWRVLTTDMTVQNIPRIRTIVKATCVLHNILREQIIAHHIPEGFVDHEDVGARGPLQQVIRLGAWRDEVRELDDMTLMSGTNVSIRAKKVRDRFCRFFSSAEGSVSWQESRVTWTGNRRPATD